MVGCATILGVDVVGRCGKRVIAIGVGGGACDFYGC